MGFLHAGPTNCHVTFLGATFLPFFWYRAKEIRRRSAPTKRAVQFTPLKLNLAAILCRHPAAVLTIGN
jgi:hypothetical protein